MNTQTWYQEVQNELELVRNNTDNNETPFLRRLEQERARNKCRQRHINSRLRKVHTAAPTWYFQTAK